MSTGSKNPRRRIHIAIGVERLDAALDFYRRLFYDTEPVIGEIELGTGRKVNGAYWKNDYIYFYVFEGHELSDVEGVDHLGIQFFDEDDLTETRNRLFKQFQKDELAPPGPAEYETGRWFLGPEDTTVWELFPNVFEEDK